MKYLQIGICEDDSKELSVLLEMLEDSEFICDCESYKSGEEFLQNFYSGRYDLILMDIYMDGINGVETVSHIRELDGTVPIAFLTTSTDHAMDGYRLRVDRYLKKPYSPAELSELLELAASKVMTQPSVQLLVQGERMTIPYSRICYVEHSGRVCLIHTISGETLKTVTKLAELSEMLPCPPFLQCHKSFLVNLSHIRCVNRELSMFEMADGGNAYIRRASMRSAEQIYHKYMFSLTRAQGGVQ